MARGRKKKVDYARIAKKRQSVLDCPEWLGKEEQAVWDHLVPLIAEECDIRGADFISLWQLVDAVARRIKVSREIDSLGSLVFKSPNGALQTHPLLKIISQCDAMIVKTVREFGVNPLSRKKLKGNGERGKPNERQEFFDFMKRKPPRGEGLKPKPDPKKEKTN